MAYAYYNRNWWHGKKRPQDWSAPWAAAPEVIRAASAQSEQVVEAPLDLAARVARL